MQLKKGQATPNVQIINYSLYDITEKYKEVKRTISHDKKIGDKNEKYTHNKHNNMDSNTAGEQA